MEFVFVKIPKTASTFFESNFCNKIGSLNGNNIKISSVGHSWLYPTQIKGWRDWDYPNQKWGVSRDVAVYWMGNNDTRIVTILSLIHI